MGVPTLESQRADSVNSLVLETSQLDSDLSDLFQRLETMCETSSYNLIRCASTVWIQAVDAHLSTLGDIEPSSSFFVEAQLQSHDFMVLAMTSTGLIPVNVEGKGDCFYLAFWYGFAGGELADRAQCLELRRLVAKVFLSKCRRDPGLIDVLREHGSFAHIREYARAEFVEAAFRMIGNFDKVSYPADVAEFEIACLSEALQVNICVWTIGKSGHPKKYQIGEKFGTEVKVHVLFNGRDHYFAFDQEGATERSLPKDCEFGVLARGHFFVPLS